MISNSAVKIMIINQKMRTWQNTSIDSSIGLFYSYHKPGYTDLKSTVQPNVNNRSQPLRMEIYRTIRN